MKHLARLRRLAALPLLLLPFLAAPALAQECARAGMPAATARPDPERLPERQQRVAGELARRQFAVVALGDSIMQGWPNELLEQAFGAPVLNAGFGREHPDHVLWRLDTLDWSRQRPRYVLLLVGTNGLGDGTCAVYWSVRDVVARARQVFPGARVIVTSILPRGENFEGHDEEIVAIDTMLRAAAASGGYAYLDAHDQFLCGHQTSCDLYNAKSAKNVHLSRAGYEILTEDLRKLIASDHP